MIKIYLVVVFSSIVLSCVAQNNIVLQKGEYVLEGSTYHDFSSFIVIDSVNIKYIKINQENIRLKGGDKQGVYKFINDSTILIKFNLKKIKVKYTQQTMEFKGKVYVRKE